MHNVENCNNYFLRFFKVLFLPAETAQILWRVKTKRPTGGAEGRAVEGV